MRFLRKGGGNNFGFFFKLKFNTNATSISDCKDFKIVIELNLHGKSCHC